MNIRYTPNAFAKKMFGLKFDHICGQGCSGLLVDALGSENYDRYMLAQDSFCGGRTLSELHIIMNRDETDPAKWVFESIGIVERV